MAIAFRAAGTVVTGANPTVPPPPGLTQGDLMIIVTTGTATPTTPTGWVQRYAQGAGNFTTILTKYATAQEASQALTLAGTTSKSVMIAYSGAGSYDVVGTVATGTSTSAATTAQTTTYANDYVISIFARTTTASTFSVPASTTSRVNSASTATINGLLLVDELKASAGASAVRTSTLSASGTWSAINISFVPARTLYWVGGTGTWSATDTGNWANTSGGTPGTIKPPAPTETATFNASSGTGTVTLTGTTDATTAACGVLSSASNSLTFAGTGNLLMSFDGSGSLTLASTNVWSNTGVITMNGLTTTVTTNTVSIASSITYNTTGGTVTLGSALTLGTTNTFTLTQGTLALANFTLSTGLFLSSNSFTRSILFGTGNITITGSGTAFTTNVATGLTYTGTPTVNISNNSATATTVTAHITGGTEANAFNFNFTTGTYALTITGGGIYGARVGDFDFTGFTGTWSTLAQTCSFYGSLTLVSGMTFTAGSGNWLFSATSGTQVITSAGKALPTIVQGNIGGTVQLAAGTTTLAPGNQYVLLAGPLDLGTNTATLSCPSFDASNGNTRSIIFGTGNITVTGTGTSWTTATATNLTYTGTPTVNISNNSATATTVTAHTTGGTEANTFNFNFTTGTYALTLTSASVIKSLNFTGFTGSWNPTGSHNLTFYGNLLLVTGMTFTNGNGTWSFNAASGTQTITSAGKTLTNITQAGAANTVQLVGTTTLSTNLTYTLTSGTLDLNNNNLSANTFSSSNTNTRSILCGTGQITLTGTGTIWNIATSTGMTLNAGTSTIVLSNTTTTARTFAGGGLTYNNLTIGGTTGISTLTFTGNNTFNTLASTKTVAHTITLPASGTTTVADWTITGTSGNVVTLNSSTAATQSTITKTGGGTITGIDYLSIQDSAATPATTWYAGNNSTNVSNNTGWIFSGYVPSNGNFFFMFN